jgi:DUF2934 family protein
MSKETTVNRATQAVTSHAGSGSEKTGPARQAARRAEANQDRISERAYELYEQRGRRDGLALEDWLQAERQLAGASGKS